MSYCMSFMYIPEELFDNFPQTPLLIPKQWKNEIINAAHIPKQWKQQKNEIINAAHMKDSFLLSPTLCDDIRVV